MKIIKYVKLIDIDVQFNDGTILQHQNYNKFKEGQILNPNHADSLKDSENKKRTSKKNNSTKKSEDTAEMKITSNMNTTPTPEPNRDASEYNQPWKQDSSDSNLNSNDPIDNMVKIHDIIDEDTTIPDEPHDYHKAEETYDDARADTFEDYKEKYEADTPEEITSNISLDKPAEEEDLYGLEEGLEQPEITVEQPEPAPADRSISKPTTPTKKTKRSKKTQQSPKYLFEMDADINGIKCKLMYNTLISDKCAVKLSKRTDNWGITIKGNIINVNKIDSKHIEIAVTENGRTRIYPLER
jgi:hypothetical protein